MKRRGDIERRIATEDTRFRYGDGYRSHDNLLQLEIPQRLFLSQDYGDHSRMHEVNISHMEIDAVPDYNDEGLPWIELETRDPVTRKLRIIRLKIPRKMILKIVKSARGKDGKIRLRSDDISKYFEQSGAIPVGSSVRMHLKHPQSAASGYYREGNVNAQESSSRRSHSHDRVMRSNYDVTRSREKTPAVHLAPSKSTHAASSWNETIKQTNNQDRRVKFHDRERSKSTEDIHSIHVNDYESKSNFVPVALTRDSPRSILLADGTTWKRVSKDDLDNINKIKKSESRASFRNSYEIGRESEAESFPDLRKFSNENARNTRADPKIFDYLIDDKNKGIEC